MASYLFGSGYMYLKDSTGNIAQVGVLQDVSLDISAQSKELRGAQQFPLAVAISARKVDGKAKHARLDGKLMASLLSATPTAGRTMYQNNVPLAFSASVTVSPTGTAFVADLGVIDATGNPMTLTGSTPAVGSYSVAAGVYTFNAGQTGTGSFSWAYSTGSGYSFTLSNLDMGIAPTYELHLAEEGQDPYDGTNNKFSMKLFAVAIPKLSVAWKNEDFAVEDLDFSAQANALGQVAVFNYE
jgi:hypothetical protein